MRLESCPPERFDRPVPVDPVLCSEVRHQLTGQDTQGCGLPDFVPAEEADNRTIVRSREVIQSKSVFGVLVNELTSFGRKQDDSNRVVGNFLFD